MSQDIENRTYRNFGMYFFDTKNGQFTPRGFDPKPFGMYGVPGNPNDLIKEMQIPALNDTNQQIAFLKDLIQSSVAQTATERGEQQSLAQHSEKLILTSIVRLRTLLWGSGSCVTNCWCVAWLVAMSTRTRGV